MVQVRFPKVLAWMYHVVFRQVGEDVNGRLMLTEG